MAGAKRAPKVETPKQPSLDLMLRAPYFCPTPSLGVPILSLVAFAPPRMSTFDPKLVDRLARRLLLARWPAKGAPGADGLHFSNTDLDGGSDGNSL